MRRHPEDTGSPSDVTSSSIVLVHETVRHPLERLLEEMPAPYAVASSPSVAIAVDCLRYLRALAQRQPDANPPDIWLPPEFKYYAEVSHGCIDPSKPWLSDDGV
jgi:hypothetical protein